MSESQLPARLRTYLPVVLGALLGVVLLLIWAEHDGGYDQDTWYWGALLLLAMLPVVWLTRARGRHLSGRARCAVAFLALYVAWSYLSIIWAGSKGDALDGSNRALLYLILFAFFLSLPWTPRAGLLAFTLYALGIGAIAVYVFVQLDSGRHLSGLVFEGRLIAPTGYFNASVSLFMTTALFATVLSVRRELPAPIRGALIALACPCLQLALIGESRGWLFTLPLVLLCLVLVVRNRFRAAGAALLPAAATLIPIHRFLAVYQDSQTSRLHSAGIQAAHASFVSLAIVFVVGTLLALGDRLVPAEPVSPRARRLIGVLLACGAVGAAVAGGLVATHGRPLNFIERQWRGFAHEETAASSSSASYFGTVGSGRYDFWRVALQAFSSHPLGGLGQDNFADYYITRRHTGEEPTWAHSLELQFLASTGAVGALLFLGFLIAALGGALRAVRQPSGLTAAVAGISLVPLIDWVLHGSVDWFWAIPALTGPALGFLAVALALDEPSDGAEIGSAGRTVRSPRALGRLRRASGHLPRALGRVPQMPRTALAATAALAYVAAAAALGLTYLSVREVSIASNVRTTDPQRALDDLRLASRLDPLWAQPGRVAGTIALQTGRLGVAVRRFGQAAEREPGGWYAWFGKGLAEAALDELPAARRDLSRALAIETRQPVIRMALNGAETGHPLNPVRALYLIKATV